MGTHKLNGPPDNRILSTDGALVVVTNVEIELDDGLVIKFEPTTDSKYRSGDYWLIRTTSTGTVSILPGDTNTSGSARNDHHFAPLFRHNGDIWRETSRSEFPEVGQWPPKNRIAFESFAPCSKPTAGAPPAAAITPVAITPVNVVATFPERSAFSPQPIINPVSLLSGEGARAEGVSVISQRSHPPRSGSLSQSRTEVGELFAVSLGFVGKRDIRRVV